MFQLLLCLVCKFACMLDVYRLDRLLNYANWWNAFTLRFTIVFDSNGTWASLRYVLKNVSLRICLWWETVPVWLKLRPALNSGLSASFYWISSYRVPGQCQLHYNSLLHWSRCVEVPRHQFSSNYQRENNSVFYHIVLWFLGIGCPDLIRSDKLKQCSVYVNVKILDELLRLSGIWTKPSLIWNMSSKLYGIWFKIS